MTRQFAVGVVILCTSTAAFAFDWALNRRAIEEAIAIGQSRVEPIRSRFHADYRVVVNRAPVDYVEAVTPFRRVVLAAERRARAGDRSFGLREAQQMLMTSANEVWLHVELTFHPQNTFIAMPPYEVALTARGGGAEIPLLSVERVPRFGPRIDGLPTEVSPGGMNLPTGGQPLTGGAIVAKFFAQNLDPRGAYELVITEGNATLARVRIDLARLR